MRKDDWEVIATLCQYPNLTKAANMLFISQPALTKRLQQIEEDFGVSIVNRTSKGVVFTPQGEYLARQAEKFIQMLQETHYHLAQMGQGDSGVLKIGAPSSAARFLLPKILAQYGAAYPQVSLHVQVMLSGQILQNMQRGEIHLGFMNGDRPHHEYQLLYSVGRGFIVSKNPLSLQDLPHTPMILHSRDRYSRDLIDQWWKSVFPLPPVIGMEVSDIDTCLRMVQNGLGYGIMYDNYLLEANYNLSLLPMSYRDGTPLTRNTWLVCPADYEKTPLIKNFAEFVRENHL